MHNGLVVVGNESLMKSIFMRVLLCKIHCPSFICFCKPSAAHLYTPGPLKLENTPHVPSSVVSVTDTSNLSGEANEVREGNLDDEKKQHAEIALRSCIRKVSPELSAPNEVQRKRVQWVDKLGKELVEIKEFESRYTLFPLFVFVCDHPAGEIGTNSAQVCCWDLVVVLEQDSWCSDHSDEEYEVCKGTFEDAVARYIENSKVGNSRKKLFREKERTECERLERAWRNGTSVEATLLHVKVNQFGELANPMLEILPCKSFEETSSSIKESGVKTEDQHWIKRLHGKEDFEMESVTGFASDSESQRTLSKVQQSELKYWDLKPNLELLKDELGMKILKEDLDRRRACFCSSGQHN
ncbi:hypothetical protein RJ639_031593 [Escallonia herrerae]|uniref:Uncharacterized protein n=1 Tax=Escallonia herrerae TaxID=1293975 RepID=A0AA89BBA4_9ASTE|nr:hypothetical protein RJ639_031593 [Escallonia herrerae]